MTENRTITIFVVEDDPSIRFGLSEIFKSEGFAVLDKEDGVDATKEICEARPDLVILDVMLPGKSGYEICKELRDKNCRVPILMLTAKGQEIDKVVGLDAGADDYVTKPFGVQELKARVNALLRRPADWHHDAKKRTHSEFQIGSATISEDTYEATVASEVNRLTPKEMELLLYLHRNQGKVLTRDQILDVVWGQRYLGTTRTLDQCVAQLRKKIGDTGKKPQHIVTVHGVGYQLN